MRARLCGARNKGRRHSNNSGRRKPSDPDCVEERNQGQCQGQWPREHGREGWASASGEWAWYGAVGVKFETCINIHVRMSGGQEFKADRRLDLSTEKFPRRPDGPHRGGACGYKRPEAEPCGQMRLDPLSLPQFRGVSWSRLHKGSAWPSPSSWGLGSQAPSSLHLVYWAFSRPGAVVMACHQVPLGARWAGICLLTHPTSQCCQPDSGIPRYLGCRSKGRSVTAQHLQFYTKWSLYALGILSSRSNRLHTKAPNPCSLLDQTPGRSIYKFPEGSSAPPHSWPLPTGQREFRLHSQNASSGLEPHL